MVSVAIAALAGLAVGWYFEPVLGWAVFGLALLVFHLDNRRQLRRLGRWLEHGESPYPPRARGAWDEFHAKLHRSRRAATTREADLAEALARWRAAARALPDGVVILDEERIAWLNDTARAHLEIDPATDVGRPLTHLVRIPEFLEYLERGDFVRPVIVQAPHAAGRVLSLQVVQYGENQKLVLSRDITQFRQVDRMRREFVANVSHELRTPLTVVSGFLETLRDESDPEAAQRYIAMMSEQAKRMERLVEDLLTLSALESSPAPAMEEAIDMRSLTERLGADARALSGGRHDIEVSAETGVNLLGNESEIASALGNLVSNAVRYTPPGGSVRLRWHGTPDGADFDVEDTGIGIAAEHIPRLTERFYRVDRGRSRETGGTGLGLAIVKHALGRHGATLDVVSEPGEGSRFTARFGGGRVRKEAA
ncbi:MAG TPA: phosphate regulon sensor histidine kinase PhoR [Usitatibacter sp.]|jgi:two-component system phosphate regulon sensor histidine kinase PhoR|nr:phosphate regulon sensor histidine kinase PhoR [Usitatibacter sp.]